MHFSLCHTIRRANIAKGTRYRIKKESFYLIVGSSSGMRKSEREVYVYVLSFSLSFCVSYALPCWSSSRAWAVAAADSAMDLRN